MAGENITDISSTRRVVSPQDNGQMPQVDMGGLDSEVEVTLEPMTDAATGEQDVQPAEIPHDANLAEIMADEEGGPALLAEFGLDLIDLVDADKDSRSDWEDVFKDGLKLMGIQGSKNGELSADNREEIFEGASDLFHPLITEACIQFQSEALKAMLPPKGPVGTNVVGDETPEKLDQARRVAGFMNYLVTDDIKGYFEEHDKMLAYLGKSGSAFKKIYYSRITDKICVTYLPAEQVVVPYNAKSMSDAARIAHIEDDLSADTMAHRMASGLYRQVDITPSSETEDAVAETLAAQQGVSQTMLPDQDTYCVYEILVNTVVPSFEGDRGSLSAPYIVHVEAESGTVLGIYRNWREGDPVYERRDFYVHYPLIQSDGFYGYGFIHVLGQLAKASSSTLRQLLDAGTLSNLQGGFKRKGTRIANDGEAFTPGEYRDVEVFGDRISDSIMQLNFKEPSNVLFQLMGFLVDAGRRMVSLTDLNVGDGNQQAAGGTTIAMLERGMNVMSAVHMRLCRSQKEEFKIIARLCKEHLPEQYPYDVPGQTREVFVKDFDDRVDVIPVCDPRQFSQAQRMARAQAKLQLAQQFPHIFNEREAARDMLREIDDSNVDRLLPPEDKAEPTDPIKENMDALTGKPLKAFIQQNHEAHIGAHTAQLQNPQFQDQAQMQQALQSHIQEHMAFKYQVQMMQAMGVTDPKQLDQMPPEQIAVMAAQATQKITGQAQALAEAEQRGKEPTLEQQALMKETDNNRREIERKAAKDQMDHLIDRLNLTSDQRIAVEKILQTDRNTAMTTAAKVSKDQQDGLMTLIGHLKDYEQQSREQDDPSQIVSGQ